MRGPSDPTGQQSTDTLQVGPARPPYLPGVPTRWRPPVVLLLGFVLGIAAGGGAALWQQERSVPGPGFSVRGDEHAVELMLLEAAEPRTRSSGRGSGSSWLHVESAVLLSGLVTSTVLEIDNPGTALEVRAPALPVTVRPTDRFRSLDLALIVRDCTAAARWIPEDRPFTISWRDEHGREHLDRAGDFDRSMAASLTRYVDGVCDLPSRR